MVRFRRAFGFAAVTLALAVAGCGGGSGYGKSPTTAPTVSTSVSARTVVATAPSALGIRDRDLSKVADVAALLSASGGTFVQSSVIYADLTGDGVDEAVAPLSSGGTMGDIAFLVLTPTGGGGTKTLLKESPAGQTSGLAVSVEGGQLVMTQPVYGTDDPNCCPSSLRKTTYAWDGTALAVQSVRTEANPRDGGKATPPP